MSDYMSDISSFLAMGAAAQSGRVSQTSQSSQTKTIHGSNTQSSGSLDMNDFLSLIVAQFQNQSIDNTADTSDMLNQLVQMSTIQAITNVTDATVMMYAGSLVGKEVTVGEFNSEGKLEEIVGVVTGTGVASGQQVIFVNGKSYLLSDIMAVGRLPDIEEPGEGGDGEGGDGDGDGNTTPPVES